MILNLTQHAATEDQRAQGVVDLPDEQRKMLQQLLGFDKIPSTEEIMERAQEIAELACYNGLSGDGGDSPFPIYAMIGGAPFLMAPLERALRERGIQPLYAFSVRQSVEKDDVDGKIVKTSVFKHAGFVPAA